MTLTGVELHALGIILLVVMAVDTLAVDLGAAEHVVDHHLLVVVLQTALVQRQFFVGDVAGRDETVADIGIDAVLRHADLERLVTAPLSVAAGKHLDVNIAIGGLAEQLAPLVHVGLHLTAATDQFVPLGTEACHHLVAASVHLERQRRNVHRHRHVAVVGINNR